MKCLMFGLACDQEQFDDYTKRYKNPYSVAHYLFEKKMVEELEKNYTIDHNYIFQCANRKLSDAWIKGKQKHITEGTITSYLSYLNLPILKFITLFFATLFRIFTYYWKNKGDFFVMSTINYFPIALATILMSHILKFKNVIIFTDCSVGYAYDQSESKSFKAKIRRAYKKVIHSLENKYDAYILFSPKMNELVNQRKKPHCVMEGFFNADELNMHKVEKFARFTIIYAGTIIESVGLQNLVQALKLVDKHQLELRIYGEGEYKEKLQKLAKNDSRVKFYGFINRSELFSIEKAASLLINVRDPELAYTKYSFPSKTFEYLASGTPFLSTYLECYSEEYRQFIYFIEDNEPITIANKLEEILLKSERERADFGVRAQNFVLNRKNSSIQVKRVVEFLNQEIV